VQDETYRQGLHELHETQRMADEMCRYDLDDLDSAWLANYNDLRQEHGTDEIWGFFTGSVVNYRCQGCNW